MTISTENSSIIVSCNGSQTAFQYNFVADQASDISVSSIASTGSITPLTTGYTVSVNAPAPNQLWGVGGSVIFSVDPAAGTSLLIQRVLPLTQSTSIQNQGNIYPQVIETAMDTLEMQLQQIAGRTTQFQGIWTTATTYTVGDIVQDGTNGNDTLNYYICQVGNTSGVWSSDLASGYWAISVVAVVPSSNQPITLSGAISGTGSTSITTTLANNIVTNSSLVSGAVTLTKLAEIPANTVLCNTSASSGNVMAVSNTSFISSLGIFSTINTQIITSTGTYTPTAGMLFADVQLLGGGGGSGGTGGTSSGGYGGSGGGAGGYSRKIITSTSIGTSQSITIAAGGTAGGAANGAGGIGGSGGTTIFGTSLLSAGGGVGGYGANSTPEPGGSGGIGTFYGIATQGAIGGTGLANGVGPGGSTFLGGGAASVSNNNSSYSVGNAGVPNSGGGASGSNSGGSSGGIGAVGGSGIAIITEYCT